MKRLARWLNFSFSAFAINCVIQTFILHLFDKFVLMSSWTLCLWCFQLLLVNSPMMQLMLIYVIFIECMILQFQSKYIIYFVVLELVYNVASCHSKLILLSLHKTWISNVEVIMCNWSEYFPYSNTITIYNNISNTITTNILNKTF